eukprot:403350605
MSCFSCLPSFNKNNTDKLKHITQKQPMAMKIVQIKPQQIEPSQKIKQDLTVCCGDQVQIINSTWSIPTILRACHVQEKIRQSLLGNNMDCLEKLQQSNDKQKKVFTVRLFPENFEKQNDQKHNLINQTPFTANKRKLLSDIKPLASEKYSMGFSLLNTEPSSMKSQLSQQSKIINTPNSKAEIIQHQFSQSDIKNLTDSFLDSILDINLVSSGENSFEQQKFSKQIITSDLNQQKQIKSKQQQQLQERKSSTAKKQNKFQEVKKTAQQNQNKQQPSERTLDQKIKQLLTHSEKIKNESENPWFQGENQSNFYDEPSDQVILGTPRVEFQY